MVEDGSLSAGERGVRCARHRAGGWQCRRARHDTKIDRGEIAGARVSAAGDRSRVVRRMSLLAALLLFAQTVRIDATPGHAINAFDPDSALGSSIDVLS